MRDLLFRLTELAFTAYAIPAMLVPLVWLGGHLTRRHTLFGFTVALETLLKWYFVSCLVWLVAWAAMRLGFPVDRSGKTGLVVCWLAFGAANALLALLLVRFTGEYGSLPAGEAADRLFTRLLGAIALQPVATAVAFAVLYRASGVIWDLHVIGLPAVQEGI